MDPLTHTLVGANLAATRLGRSTPLATAALLIGVNAPDIDVLAYLEGSDFAFGFRRGWTHGLPALVVLPALVTAGLLAWDRLVRSGAAERADPGRLLVLCFLAGLTHPCLDWLNNYGMRWLMPIDGTWSYGDAVFIMDPWLWLILGSGWLLGREPGRWLVLGWLLFTALILAVVLGRASPYAPAVLAVSAILLAALLYRPAPGRAISMRARLGLASLALAGLFMAGMVGLQQASRARVAALLDAGQLAPDRLLVGPTPVNPLHWDVVADLGDHYRVGRFRWPGGQLTLAPERLPVPAADDPQWAAARSHPSVAGFMTWSRFPWSVREAVPGGVRVTIMDARYVKSPSEGFGSTSVIIEP